LSAGAVSRDNRTVRASERVDAAERFLAAFDGADFSALRALLSDGLVAHVTTDDGGESLVHGADAYVASLREMISRAPVEYRVAFTQQPVIVGDDRVLVMLEIRAARNGSTLHNYSAQLFRWKDDLICEIQMTDAKPEESARFWA
jgi:ketosteroid isomerase-like protein